MKLALVPFWSQQSKVDGNFLFDSDSGCRICAYIKERAPAAVIFSPPPGVPVDNRKRRFWWDVDVVDRLGEFDTVFLQHETLAIPLKLLHPYVKVVTEFGMKPGTAWPETEFLHEKARQLSDVVACNSAYLADLVDRSVVWRWGYDAREVRTAEPEYDAAFPARISATGYTNYDMFKVASAGMRTFVSDPTQALGCDHLSRDEYLDNLSRCRTVVGLTDNGYGGWAFVEAVACGCCPVALRTPAYEELLTDRWPYLADTLSDVRRVLRMAVERGWSTQHAAAVRERVKQYSYQATWELAKKELT